MKRILLSLENLEHRQVLENALSGGYRVEVAGAVALDNPFDLAILDEPGLKAWGAPLKARKEAAAPLFLPVLLVTDRQDLGRLPAGRRRLADDLLVTPLEPVEAQLRVATLLRARRLSGEVEAVREQALAQATQRQAETTALLKAARAVMEHHTFDEAARVIFDAAKELIGAISGYVALLSEDGRENVVLFLEPGGLPCTVDPRLPMPIRGLRAKAYRMGQPVYDNDFPRSDYRQFLPKGHARLENVLFAPLNLDGKTVGLLGLANKPGGFTDNDARLAAGFGELAAIALVSRQAQEEIARLASIPQLNPNPVLEVDYSGALTYYNDAALKVVEKLGGPGVEAWLPPDLPAILEMARERGEGLFYREVSLGEAVFAQHIHFLPQFQRVRLYTMDITARQQVEEVLRRAKQEWELTFDAVPDLICILDQEHRIRRVNRAMATALGVEPGELVGQPCYEYMHRTTAPPEFCPHARLLADGLEHQAEVHERGRDFLVTASPLHDAQGKVLGSVHVARDITARKQGEQALRESREDLNRAQAVAHTGSWRLDVRKNELLWSDETHRIFGIPQGTPLTYEAFLAAVHPEDREYVDRKWMAALRGKPYDLEHRIVVGDTLKWVRERAEMEFDPQGLLLGGFGTVQDITGRKRAEEALKEAHDQLEQRVEERTRELRRALEQLLREMEERQEAEGRLRESEARFAAFMQYLPGAAAIRDLKGRLLFANDTWARVVGKTREEWLGKTFADVWPPEMAARFQALDRQVIASRQALERVEPLPEAEGLHYWLTSRFPILGPEGQPIMVGTIGIDITGRQQAEEALEAERQRFFAVLENLPGFVCLLAPDYTLPYANRLFRERLGEPRGRRCYELLFTRSEPCENCQTFEVLKTGAPQEWEWTGPDGCIYAIYDYPFADVDGSPLILEMGIDITDRKQAEEALRQVNRALKTLSEANQALVRATREAELFQEVCRTLVHTGGYRLAWVGLAEADREKTVRPVARAGYDAGYLESLGITWADVPRGRGPTGTAIRTGRVTVARDIATDPRFGPWREEAVKRGYASSIVLPLVTQRRVWGALNIYAPEPDAFGPEEVKLLSDLADNMAYGINALRAQEARRRNAAALRESEIKLRLLTSQLLTAQEEERRRLSRELHDELGQSLMVLKMQVRGIVRQLPPGQPVLKEDCEGVLRYIDEVIENTRRLSRDLSPAILEDLGLTAALKHLLEDTRRHYAIQSCSLEFDEVEGLIPKEAEINIYRVFQECLTNIGKHAHPERVTATIRREAGKIAFVVEDNGVGFDMKEVLARGPRERGLGLAAMAERVRMLGGSSHLWSQKGVGTRITFTIPARERETRP
jgi:PAS domain S-box-containing protein